MGSSRSPRAESESVQLRACRAILADNMAVSKFSDLQYRMAEIEEQLDKRAEHTHPALSLQILASSPPFGLRFLRAI